MSILHWVAYLVASMLIILQRFRKSLYIKFMISVINQGRNTFLYNYIPLLIHIETYFIEHHKQIKIIPHKFVLITSPNLHRTAANQVDAFYYDKKPRSHYINPMPHSQLNTRQRAKNNKKNIFKDKRRCQCTAIHPYKIPCCILQNKKRNNNPKTPIVRNQKKIIIE